MTQIARIRERIWDLGFEIRKPHRSILDFRFEIRRPRVSKGGKFFSYQLSVSYLVDLCVLCGYSFREIFKTQSPAKRLLFSNSCNLWLNLFD
jgi:hypothetical protein